MGGVRRTDRATTLSELVYTSVRGDILAGRLRPGERLRLAVLTDRHGVSLSVVREALTRLAAQKLVTAEPQLGFAVTTVSSAELEDLTAVRCDIEGLALRRAIQRGDIAWEGRLVAAHHVVANTRATAPGEPQRVTEEWATAHAVFHAALVDGCNSPLLLQIRRSLYDAAELYRRWSLPAEVQLEIRRDVPAEHRALMEATLARDADRAVALLVEHIRFTTRILLESM
jgi:DNA-binding GntR family transcriptional regulator